jgi:ATP-dependent Clp protease ATP-binding subunit ClpA
VATPLIAKELQASFREALADAKKMRHEYSPEHLLLALTGTEDPESLVACGANVKGPPRLEKFLAETVERLPDGAPPSAATTARAGAAAGAIASAEQKVIAGR